MLSSEHLSDLLGCPVSGVQETRRISLWKGYGYLQCLDVVTSGLDAGISSSSSRQLVHKFVDPPNSSGVGHERKVQSYMNEALFYVRIPFHSASP